MELDGKLFAYSLSKITQLQAHLVLAV